MMHVFQAEWGKLMRKGMVLGGAGALVALAALGTLLVFSQADVEPVENGERFAAQILEQSDGPMQSLGITGQILGAVSLVLFARTVTDEYAHKTLKVALIREPRRTVFLTGKFLATGVFVGAAAFVSFLAALVVGATVATARGMDTAQWWDGTGMATQMLGFLRFEVAILVWGLFGFALGTIFRSGAVAIGIGISVIFVGGHLLERFWADAGAWLPSLVLLAFTVGGNADISLGVAAHRAGRSLGGNVHE